MTDALFPRRTFLKGLGTAMGIPLLEAMVGGSAWAATGTNTAPVRIGFVFLPNGVIMDHFEPDGKGTKFTLPKSTKPLEKVKNDCLFITGLAQDNGRPKGDGPGDHARSAAPFLTGAHPYKTSGANIKLGISVDQAAAAQIGRRTKLPSLELGIERGRSAGNCDSGYSCAYSSNIAWKSATTPVAKEINPRLVFERLFGNDKGTAARRAKRILYRKSILDLVAADAKQLQSRLGKTDRQKMAEYFTSVREIEQRIARAETNAKRRKPNFETPSGIPRDRTEHLRLMYDLMVLALQTDTTRIVTFMAANAGSNRSYPMVDVSSGWHSISHHRNKKEKKEQLQRIDQYHVTQFAYFVEKLKAV